MNTRKLAGMIATTATAIALSGAAFAADTPAGASGGAVGADDTVHCYGVNSCKGTADCATANHECKGQNECAGHGFKAETASKCLSDGGVISDLG